MDVLDIVVRQEKINKTNSLERKNQIVFICRYDCPCSQPTNQTKTLLKLISELSKYIIQGQQTKLIIYFYFLAINNYKLIFKKYHW